MAEFKLTDDIPPDPKIDPSLEGIRQLLSKISNTNETHVEGNGKLKPELVSDAKSLLPVIEQLIEASKPFTEIGQKVTPAKNTHSFVDGAIFDILVSRLRPDQFVRLFEAMRNKKRK